MSIDDDLLIIGVVALVTQDKKILCVRRVGPMWEDMLSLPGGILEAKEGDIDGLVREVKEETGYDISVKSSDPILVSEIVYNGKPAIFKIFEAKILGGSKKLQRDEVKDILWVNPKDYLESLSEHGFPARSIVEIKKMLSNLKLL